jgi:hypothetical protein
MAECLWHPRCSNMADTDEDVLPDWLRRHKGVKSHTKAMWQIEHLANGKRGKRQQSLYMKAYRCVCAQCNNGWMSEIQDQAKNVIRPMTDALVTPISLADRGRLASWAAMTSITCEYAHKRRVDRQRRTYFYDHRSLPNMRVFLSELVGKYSDSYGVMTGFARPGHYDSHLEFMVLTLWTVGFWVLQGAMSPSQVNELARHVGSRLVPIFPVVDVEGRQWPPEHALTFDETYALLERIVKA